MRLALFGVVWLALDHRYFITTYLVVHDLAVQHGLVLIKSTIVHQLIGLVAERQVNSLIVHLIVIRLLIVR